MNDQSKPPPLCPAHTADIRALECDADGCGVTDVRRYYKGMGRPIIHPIPADIAALPVSRQRKLELLWERDGLCSICGRAPIVAQHRCSACIIPWREYQRLYKALVRRRSRWLVSWKGRKWLKKWEEQQHEQDERATSREALGAGTQTNEEAEGGSAAGTAEKAAETV